MASLYLASKIEESPRRVRDVINVFHRLKLLRQNKKPVPRLLDQSYTDIKNEVIKAERRVLKELGFCVHVKHPHKLINCYLQMLGYVPNPGKSSSSKQNAEMKQLMQYSWNCMNDGLRSDVFMRYTPEAIACGCIYLASRKADVPLPDQWWLLFDCNEPGLIEIARALYKLYTVRKPSWLKLEAHVRELRARLKERDAAKLAQKGGVSASCTPGATPAQNEKSKFSPAAQRSNDSSPRRKKKRKDERRDRRRSGSDGEFVGSRKRGRNRRGRSSESRSSHSPSPPPRRGHAKRSAESRDDRYLQSQKYLSSSRDLSRKRKQARSRSLSESPEDRRKEIKRTLAVNRSAKRRR